MERKRAKFLKSKICVWCGSSDSLCIHIPRTYSPAQVKSEISGRFAGRNTRSSNASQPANIGIKATLTGIKPQLCIKPSLTILTLRNNFPMFFLRTREKAILKSFITSGLKKPGLMNWLRRKLKKQRKNANLWQMQLCSANAAILQASGVWISVQYAGKNTNPWAMRPVLTACLTRKKWDFGKGKTDRYTENSESPYKSFFESCFRKTLFREEPSRFLHMPCMFRSQDFRIRYRLDMLLQAEQRVRHPVPRKLHKLRRWHVRSRRKESIFPEHIQYLYRYGASYHLRR